MLIALIVIVVVVALVGFAIIGFNKLRTTDIGAQEALGGQGLRRAREGRLRRGHPRAGQGADRGPG
jgi:LemA protein